MDDTTLAELLLVSLYDLAAEQPHTYFFFSLDEIGSRLGATDMGKMMKAVQILEGKGLAMLSVGPWSALSAMISNDGIMFVEQGGETGIIKAYRQNPREIMDMVSNEVQAPPESLGDTTHEGEPKGVPVPSLEDTVNTILSHISDTLTNDATLPPSLREDALRDLESLRMQLGRSSRNWKLIETLLDALAEIPSLLPGLKDLALVLKNVE